jgi:hypothetical protein
MFCEWLPDVAAYVRKTDGLEEVLLAIALELVGSIGARFTEEPGLLIRRDAMLSRVQVRL